MTYTATKMSVSTGLLTGLVFAYEFDETSGTVSEDLVSTNDGTSTNATVNQTGISGKAYQLNATGLVSVPHNSVQNITDGDITTKNFTYSFWVKETTRTAESFIFRKRYGSEIGVISNNGAIELDFAGLTVTSGSLGGNGTIALNSWKNIIITGTLGTIRVYIDNTLTGTLTLTGTRVASTNVMDFGVAFIGLIDQSAAWNRVVTAEERALIATPTPFVSW